MNARGNRNGFGLMPNQFQRLGNHETNSSKIRFATTRDSWLQRFERQRRLLPGFRPAFAPSRLVRMVSPYLLEEAFVKRPPVNVRFRTAPPPAHLPAKARTRGASYAGQDSAYRSILDTKGRNICTHGPAHQAGFNARFYHDVLRGTYIHTQGENVSF